MADRSSGHLASISCLAAIARNAKRVIRRCRASSLMASSKPWSMKMFTRREEPRSSSKGSSIRLVPSRLWASFKSALMASIERGGGIDSPSSPTLGRPRSRHGFSHFAMYKRGEGGIRTLDAFPHTHFPGVLLRPLGHLSGFALVGRAAIRSSLIPAHALAATVAPFRAWRGSQPDVAGGPDWTAIDPAIRAAQSSGSRRAKTGGIVP